MLAPRPNQRLSRLAYVLLVSAFGAMVLVAVERTLRLEMRMADDERLQAEQELQRILGLWEDLQLDRIGRALKEVAQDPLARAARPPDWVDAVLVWQPEHQGRPGRMLFPPPATDEDIATLLTDPCLVEAQARAQAQSDRLLLGQAWEGCSDRAPPVALLAVSRAADQYLAGGHPAEALAALQAPDVPLLPQADLRQALGLSWSRVVARQLQAAEALRQLGRDDEAIAMLEQVGRQIVTLDGAALDQVQPFLEYPVLADLRTLGATDAAQRLSREGAAARRRLAGYRELAERLRSGSSVMGAILLEVSLPRGDDNEDRVQVPVSAIADPYGERRYLLALAHLPSGLVVALQIDPRVLLADLLRETPGPPLQVRDAEGRVVLPIPAAAGSVLAQVPFGRLLPELRLAVLASPDRAQDRRAWRSSQLVPITIGLLVAVLAGFARLAAERQQRELWDRQQAFVNRVSHELKTPLAGVKVMAELMEMGVVQEPKEIVETSQRIITEVSRMEDRVNGILKQARRAEIGSKEQLDVRAMAEDLAEVWTPRFEQRGARLVLQLEDTPPVLGDRELIRDALSNLLDNALKYLREDAPGLVHLRTWSAGRWVHYEVADNGIGVPPEMRRAIFERFTRVEGDGRGKAGGHGLGLAFVAEAVVGHGGKVECTEGIAGGARFTIRLRRS